MNLTAAQNDALAGLVAEVGKWDGSRIRALIALLQKYLPIILPYLIPLVTAEYAEKVGEVGAVEEETENLSALDWQALIKLILQILAVLFPPQPAPIPDDGPVA